jgi:hypothetical protein
MAFKMRSGNKPGFKKMGATEAIKQVDTEKAAKGKGSEREIYKAKLRGDYMDLTGDKLKKASYDDHPEELIKSHSIPESPAKQRLKKGGEAQDEDKIFNKKGEHVGNYVNGKKVMLTKKQPSQADFEPAYPGADYSKEQIAKMTEKEKMMKIDGYEPKKQKINKGRPNIKKSPNKSHTKTHTSTKTKKWYVDNYETHKNKKGFQEAMDKAFGGKTRMDGKISHTEKESPAKQKSTEPESYGKFHKKIMKDGPKHRMHYHKHKKSTTSKHGQLNDAKRDHDMDKGRNYWYKIDGKPVTKTQYLKYENKPGSMEGGGKTTNHPDVYGKKASNFGRGPKNKKK